MITSPITQFNLHIPVTPILLFVAGALLIALWSIFTLVIRYHWKNYGTGKIEVFTMNFFYLTGSVILIALMSISTFLYFSSAGG